MKITWCGHSAFTVSSDSGLVRLLFDPYIPGSWDGALQYGPIHEPCDVIFVSHRHDGHFGYNAITGNKTLIRGCGQFWVHNITVTGVKTWHDDTEGRERGENTAFAFRMENIGVAHMGDIGHTLTDDQIAVLGDVDVLMVPIGGHSTVDAAGAWRIVEQLSPSVVLPMHYKTDRIDAALDGLEPFTAMFSKVETAANPLELTADNLPGEPTLMILPPAC